MQKVGPEEFGVAECLKQLDDKVIAKLQKALKRVSIEQTTVAEGGQSARVVMSNANVVELKYQDGRFVIDQF